MEKPLSPSKPSTAPIAKPGLPATKPGVAAKPVAAKPGVAAAKTTTPAAPKKKLSLDVSDVSEVLERKISP